MEQSQLSKKILISVLTSSFVLFPFVLGSTCLMFSWAAGGNKTALFSGIVGIFASFGFFFTKLFISGEDMAKKVVEQEERKAQETLEKDLDNLAILLSNDQDERDDNLLDDLRELHKKFRERKENKNEISQLGLRLEIGGKIDALFYESINTLKISHDLLTQSRMVRKKSERQEILNRREEMLEDISNAVKKIGDSVLLLESKKTNDPLSGTAKLKNLSNDLDNSIQIAKKVEERLSKQFGEAKISE